MGNGHCCAQPALAAARHAQLARSTATGGPNKQARAAKQMTAGATQALARLALRGFSLGGDEDLGVSGQHAAGGQVGVDGHQLGGGGAKLRGKGMSSRRLPGVRVAAGVSQVITVVRAAAAVRPLAARLTWCIVRKAGHAPACVAGPAGREAPTEAAMAYRVSPACTRYTLQVPLAGLGTSTPGGHG